MKTKPKKRCAWVPENDRLYMDYHDKEWGVPVHDDRTLFEFLTLEGFQAGLSWRIVLNKRDHFRAAFNDFHPLKIARYDRSKVSLLMTNKGIIRNKLKIQAAITNAAAFLGLQEQFGSFDRYIWDFVEGNPIKNRWKEFSQIPASTPLSDKISKDLKQRGFKFVGTTICYSHMQATGMVNDDTTDCFRYSEV
jgi:DNA-3-methyladenine glycosylase I